MSLTRQWSAKVVGVHYDMCVVLYSNMGYTDGKTESDLLIEESDIEDDFGHVQVMKV